MNPFAGPHVASVVMGLTAVALALAALDTVFDAFAAPLALRYQFACGSSRHSPTLTALYPAARSCVSMYWVRLWAVCSCMSWPITRCSELEAGPLMPLSKLFLAP